MNNKGQATLGDLNGVTVAFLLTGILFSLWIVILAAFQVSSYTSTFVYNESFTMPNATGQSFATANGRIVSVQNIFNISTGVSIPSTNYTVITTSSDITGRINWTGGNNTICALGTQNAVCGINYTYLSNTTNAPVAVGKTINALAEIPNNWLTLIAIVLAASIVIGIVIKNLSFSTSNR